MGERGARTEKGTPQRKRIREFGLVEEKGKERTQHSFTGNDLRRRRRKRERAYF